MASSLLVPISLTAKVIGDPLSVPALGGKPFNENASLESGVHVHWALPDALTRARLIADDSPDLALFPAVPDLWLVIRFNSVPPGLDAGKRSWRAWVVDSIAGTVKPLEGPQAWSAPNDRDLDTIHTAVGVLPSAARLGSPGWGVLDRPHSRFFDVLASAYYPACRKRLGFHDPLDDIPRKGRVSYTVIGWYALQEQDPLYTSRDRAALLKNWKLAHHARPNGLKEIPTVTRSESGPGTPLTWIPTGLQLSQSTPARASASVAERAGRRGGSRIEHEARLERMERAVPPPTVSPGNPGRATVQGLAQDKGPTEIRCHGTVVEVPLVTGGRTTTPIPLKDIRLYPSVQRAMAAIASSSVDRSVEFVEMLLDDLDAQKGTVAGVLDLPGAAHAATFQSVPGQSRFYARIDIHEKPEPLDASAYFQLTSAPANEGRAASQHWPPMTQRSASAPRAPSIAGVFPGLLRRPAPFPPTGPTDEQINSWVESVRKALQVTGDAAAAAGTPTDGRFVRVHDYRSDAQPASLGVLAQGRGSDGAASWLDMGDPADERPPELVELLRVTGGAIVHLPDAKNLYEEPGPRWYRPWAPSIVLLNAGRSYRAGGDGRFREDGFLDTRMTGETLTGLGVGPGPTVHARDLMADPKKLAAVPGLPSEACALAQESLLFDSDNSAAMAVLTVPPAERVAAQRKFGGAVRGLWLSREPKLEARERDALAKIVRAGSPPSPVAITVWTDPRDALFLDVSYSHPHSTVADWTLLPDHVDFIPGLGSGAINPPAAQVQMLEERIPVTASIAKVLDSAVISRMTLGPHGQSVRMRPPPRGVEEDAYTTMDVVSAPLTRFDAQLFSRDLRERCGALRLNRLRLVDVFGTWRPWDPDPATPGGEASANVWLEMPPRLPFWARLHFRFESHHAPGQAASRESSPICGILVPDHLEHALEVFDGNGRAIGQLTSDRPRLASPDPDQSADLVVRFKAHPWVLAGLGLPPTSDLDAIQDNPILRSFVESLCHQGIHVPSGIPDPNYVDHWFETGLTALLRVIDTIRAWIDRSAATPHRMVRLLGEPILLLSASVGLEGTRSGNPSELAKGPAPLPADPPTPEIPVRIGDVTRPDDGVLGCFLPEAGRFVPVHKDAAQKAMFNALTTWNIPVDLTSGLQVRHPFIEKEQASEFRLAPGQAPQPLVILADVRGGLYATCGVLPRKKITVPGEFIDAALRNVEPTFRVGPILSVGQGGTVRPIVPPPQIDGLVAEFLQSNDAPGAEGATFSATPISAAPLMADLPTDRIALYDGWLRATPGDKRT